MKVAFWSNSRGRNGVTSNLACISVISQLLHPSQAVIFENHTNINNLGSVLINPTSSEFYLKENNYYEYDGLEQVLQKVSDGRRHFSNEIITNSSISLLDKHLFYIPRNYYENEDFLEFWLDKGLRMMLSMAEEIYGEVYIDTAGTFCQSSQMILDSADIIVVNLSQNQQVLDHFFRNFKTIQKKAFYLIANYSEESIFSKEAICKEYHIPRERIGVIPYHVPFADALARGGVIPFLQKNMNRPIDNQNHFFMTSATQAVRALEAEKNSLR